MKKILPILLFSIAAVVLYQKTSAQQIKIDTSYHLFFYKGKKVKENVSLTPKGDTISYNPVKRTLKKVSKSGTGKDLDKILAEVNKTDKRMKEMMQKLAASLPRTVAPYYAKPLKEAYDEVKEVYGEALSNTMTMPEMQGSETNNRMKGDLQKLETETAKVMTQIQSYIEKYKNAPVEVPTPPEKDFRYCSQCDKEKKSLYDKLVKEFDKELRAEEDKLLGMILANERSWQLSGSEEIKGSDTRSSAMQFILKRLGQKANSFAKIRERPVTVRSGCIFGNGFGKRQAVSGNSRYRCRIFKNGSHPWCYKEFIELS